jgi:rubrerythrin
MPKREPGKRRSTEATEPRRGRPTTRNGGVDEGAWNGRNEIEVPAVELVASLARIDLEAALAYEAAAELCADEDLERHLRDFAKDHRAHVDALDEALEAEGEPATAPQAAPGSPVFAGLVRITGPLGDEVIVVTLLGNEQLTNLSYDAALAYEWDRDMDAMLRRFQEDEERHIAWLASKHEALGGDAEQPPGATSP